MQQKLLKWSGYFSWGTSVSATQKHKLQALREGFLLKQKVKMKKYRDATQRLTFEFSKILIKDYSIITKRVVKEFNLDPVGELIHGLDEKFQDYKVNSFLIGLEWDIWSGYIVVAKSVESENLAKNISDFIEEKLY